MSEPVRTSESEAHVQAALARLAEDGDADARTVVSYYRSCAVALDRAAAQLVMFAQIRTAKRS